MHAASVAVRFRRTVSVSGKTKRVPWSLQGPRFCFLQPASEALWYQTRYPEVFCAVCYRIP